ncbi:hypothetical protein DIPPA_14704 [Diplonema papillatum]|nr:hypothetical protein DIPPA_14704 [Diplonema papillatum]
METEEVSFGDGGDEDAAFQECEERLKARFLELDSDDAWDKAKNDLLLAGVLQLEEDEERRARELKERWAEIEEEEKVAELHEIQEMYKRASRRTFRRLKNFPEPAPGCYFTGDTEEEQDAYDHGEEGVALVPVTPCRVHRDSQRLATGGQGDRSPEASDDALSSEGSRPLRSQSFPCSKAESARGHAVIRHLRHGRRRRKKQVSAYDPLSNSSHSHPDPSNELWRKPYHTDAVPFSSSPPVTSPSRLRAEDSAR